MRIDKSLTKKLFIILSSGVLSWYLLSIDELLFNLVLNIIIFVVLCTLILFQGRELRRLKDEYTPKRRGWFMLFSISAFCLIPIIVSQHLKYIGQPSDILIIIATVLSPIQRASTIGILCWIYFSPTKKVV